MENPRAIGRKLRKDAGFSVKSERYYTDILKECGVSGNFVNEVGGQKADIALYHDDKPLAIVELKILDERHKFRNIRNDRDKMLVLHNLCGIECYLAVFVTDTEKDDFEDRIRELSSGLNCKFEEGRAQRSLDNKWGWCFISGRVA